MLAVIPFVLFVIAFIVRAIQSDLAAEDYVLWMLAGLAMMNLTPVVAVVQRRPVRAE